MIPQKKPKLSPPVTQLWLLSTWPQTEWAQLWELRSTRPWPYRPVESVVTASGPRGQGGALACSSHSRPGLWPPGSPEDMEWILSHKIWIHSLSVVDGPAPTFKLGNGDSTSCAYLL